MQVVQEKDESLQGYLARFSRATLGIKDLQMSDVATAIMNSMRNRASKMSLSKNPLESMHDLLKKRDKYIDAEEVDIVTKSLWKRRETETHKRKSHDDRKMTDKGKQRVVHTSKDNTRDRSTRQKYEDTQTYTPLNTPRTKVLMEIRDMKDLEWPKPMA
ncbi:Retrotransposon gag protein [Abeliophyllum distichum]|uniref:Retrotransposon gag protein n=1 Tax=Abeliophyllum distichum TaxID=126358 RepID=A0ABD1TIV9_9LAMI